MVVDEAFENAGKTPGFEIWRIEKLKVVAQDPKTYGTFYSGDSYICLSTKLVDTHFEWDIHFWLGKETSQDEAGVAAYKTVELDDHLGGAPVQYREVQEHESRKFLAHFKDGIRYLEGGIESGFRKVQRGVYEKRLFHVKGKRNVRVCQVELHARSLNKGDVFILDDGLNIYCWNGSKCNRIEKMKGTEVATRIKDEERGGKAALHIIDEGKDHGLEEKFFTVLGSRCQIADDSGDDMEFEKSSQLSVNLYRVSDASGTLEMTLIDNKPLKKSHLDTNDCFILDCGSSGVFVWVGKGCTKNEKNGAMKNGMDFIEQKGYPKWTQVTRVIEGGETPIFKQFFSNWSDQNAQVGLGKVFKKGVASQSYDKFDASMLHERNKATPKKEILPDDGTGVSKIWRVEEHDIEPVRSELHGIFFSGDCYIMLYTYKTNMKENHIIYFWQGVKSSVEEKATSAMLADKMDKDMGGIAMQVRVVQNKEPEHFLRIFRGRLIILEGGKGAGFRAGCEEDTYDSEGKRMFHVKGTTDLNARAIQVPRRAASLNSGDVIILETSEKIYMWRGTGACAAERRIGRLVIDFLTPGREPEVIREGQEPDSFWDDIGGREPYSTGKRLEEEKPSYPPRLFQFSNASGAFKVEEILEFTQEDLIEDDVMLLDTYDEVFVWIGEGANDDEKRESIRTAMDYIKSDTSGRTLDDTVILQVKQGYEPLNFTGHFQAWDFDKWSKGKTFEEIKKEMGEEKISEFSNMRITETEAKKIINYNPNTFVPEKFYSYEELTRPTCLLPRDIDIKIKEKYLTDEEFANIFGMEKHDFDAKPRWKQIDLKKKYKLF
ncbi:gelsolin, cytoplasmic-like [Actinia tenebrosa]|uniref:Gelsolin, cytoplasmic-like n=1 Tax=Actinia tenebrosa TaxID=6105 RepID=A0A6P8HEW3_ACTTE|nr:gelsolin, cytoplasmic-like [Actinia tenebrosa]